MAFRFENLEIWKSAVKYAKIIFKLANTLPPKERFSLADQIRRSSLSVSNNIAEGCASESNREFRSFLNIAIRSLFETVSSLFIAKDIGYISEREFKELYEFSEVLSKRIRAFRKTINP